MARKVVFALTGAAVVMLVAAIAVQPAALSQSEARQTTAGVLLDDFRCAAVATCDMYNGPFDPPCPKRLPCRTCEFGTQNITNCVQSSGAQCDWRSAKGTRCGKQRLGTCVSATFCTNLIWYGTFCADGPRCQS